MRRQDWLVAEMGLVAISAEANESTCIVAVSAAPSWARLTEATRCCLSRGKSLHLRGNCASHRMRSREAFDLEALACDLNLLSLVRTGTLALLSYTLGRQIVRCLANIDHFQHLCLIVNFQQLPAVVSTFVNFCLDYFRKLLTWLRVAESIYRYRNG